MQAENTLTPGSFVLEKVDSVDPSVTLAGAEFTLLDGEGTELETGLVTDENGQLKLDQLAPGTYQLVETKAPENYELDETPITFTIEKNQQTVVERTFENTLQPGTVKIVKVDEDDEERTLEGAIFRLEDESGNIIKGYLQTDENGEFQEQLAPGTYVLIETQAPTGYELDPTPHVIEVGVGALK